MQALAGAKSDVLRKQESLYRASQKLGGEGKRFKRLYSLLWWEPWMRAAARSVLSNQGSRTAGPDGVTGKAFKERMDQELIPLMEELKTGTYRPAPVRRTYIPKPGRKEKRPLGIPNIRDRVVQKAVQMILDPIYEARFEDCSYGFRPNRSTIHALEEVWHHGVRQTGYEWVVEGDIRDCFGSICHKILMKTLREDIADKKLLSLLWKMLKAGVLEDFQVRKTESGTPQGGIVSPILANVYMHRLDRWFAARYHHLTRYKRERRAKHGMANARLIRYADDFVVMVKGTQAQAEAIKRELATFIEKDLHMELNDEKTLVTSIRNGFDFLGYSFKMSPRPKDGKDGFYRYPSQKAMKEYRRKIKGLTKVNSTLSEAETLYRVNLVVVGWGNYFRYGNSKRTFSYLGDWTWHKVFQWLCRRHPKLGRKKVYGRFRTHCSESVIPRQRRGNYMGLGVPVDGGWLFLERMAAISIHKGPLAYRNIPNPYQGDGTETNRLPETYLAESSIPHRAPRLDPDFQAARIQVLERDGHKCADCKGTENLEVHHKDGRRWRQGEAEPGINEPAKLITLCRSCHIDQHRDDSA